MLAISGRHLVGRGGFNPVLAMAETIADGYGQDPHGQRAARRADRRAALGWRLFEEYLVEAAELEDVPLETLRDEHVRPLPPPRRDALPSPPDPPAHALSDPDPAPGPSALGSPPRRDQYVRVYELGSPGP